MGGRRPTIVLFAAGGRLSAAVLEGLVEAGLAPAAMVLPRPGGALFVQPVVDQGSAPGLARRYHVPVAHLSPDDGDDVRGWLATLHPDLGLMACFPRLLPMELADLPRWGTLNLHPSPLPRYRGPAPLFWQLRDGASSLWLTVHRVSAELDAGDVVMQRSRPLPMGASGADLDRHLASMGVAALAELLSRYPRGDFVGEPQDQAAASGQSWPEVGDFYIDVGWPARRAYTFMRGTMDLNQPYRVRGLATDLTLSRAVAFDPGGWLAADWARAAEDLRIRCSPGVLRARPLNRLPEDDPVGIPES